MLSIAIVEDEPAQANLLEEYLNRYSKENNEPFKVSRYEDALVFLADYKQVYDIIFMDIEMPGISGMDAAYKLRETDSVVTIIFVTNLSQYALKGYEVGALDFIVKPVSYYNFSIKIKRAIRERKLKRQRSEELPLTSESGVRRVTVASIKYIEVAGHHLIFHTFDGDIDVLGSLRDMEKQLEGKHFSRCDNSYLVNLEYVTEIGTTTCKAGGDIVPISRRRRKAFIDELTLYVGGES